MVVSAGQPLRIAASDWNDVQAMLGQWRASGRRLAPSGQPLIDLRNAALILIKNTTNAAVSAFGTLALDQPIIDFNDAANAGEKYEGVRFDGITPSTSTPHYGKFAVLQEPAAASSGFARAIISGMTLANVLINDADDVACDIANSQTAYLTSGQHGAARILWKPASVTGQKLCLIQIGDWADCMLGKTDSAINKAASGTVSIWDGAEGSEADTGVNVTAYNRFANVSSGKWVWVMSKRGRLYLTAAEC